MTTSSRTVFITVALVCSCLLFNTTTSAATNPVTFAENNGIFVSTFYNFYDYITGNKPAQQQDEPKKSRSQLITPIESDSNITPTDISTVENQINAASSKTTTEAKSQAVLVPTTLTPAGTAATPTDNDYTRINNAVQNAASGDTIILNGTFDWTETNAAASWAKGSDGIAGNDDDYVLLPPANLNDITITANTLGDATIKGPGDLPNVNLEGVFQFYATSTRKNGQGGDNQNWTISNIRFLDFDNAIGFFFDTGDSTTSFSGTKILNNYIRVPRDLNASVASADVSQNIGIHFSFGTNEQISGNTIELAGDGVSDLANNNTFSSEVGMQSNTSGGSVYDGLQITNNTVRVLNAQTANPENLRGIWENAHGHTSNITVSGNKFLNAAVGNNGNNPTTNLQKAFVITSHSSATTTVEYKNNTVQGANIGFQWLPGQTDFAGNQPVKLTSNSITNNNRGVIVQSQGLGNLSFNYIVGNNIGIFNVDGIVTAENNFFGCNTGAGTTGCDTVSGTVDTDPYAVLDLSASPTTIANGGSSTITAKFISSDTTNTNTLPFIDGIPVAFSGAVTPPQPVSLMGGTASVIYTDTSTSGDSTKTVTGTVANATDSVTFSIDDPSPFVASVTRGGAPQSTMASSVTFTVTFSEPVTGVTTDDFTAITTGNLGTNTAVAAVSPVGGFATTYTVTVSGYSTANGNGTIRLDVNSGTDIADVAGQNLTSGFTGNETYTVLMSANAACKTGRQIYDVASEFSLGGNSNCSYTYGNTSGATSDTVVKYVNPIVGAFNTSGIDGWYTAPFNSDGFPLPGIFKNNNSTTTSYLTIVQAAGSLALHPGKNGERSVLRFTVPTGGGGFYNLNGNFVGIDNGVGNNTGTTTDVKILVTSTNGVTTPFSGNVTMFGNPAAFNFPINLAVGDTVDFSVGYGTNGNYSNDSTGLSATFTPIAVQTETLYGLSGTTGAQTLVKLNSSNPSAATSVGTISGLLGTNETLLAIDFRPATGELYGLGSSSRLYTISITTGAATAVGSGPFFYNRTNLMTNTVENVGLEGTQFGFDFNPTVDRIRVVSNSGQNFRLNPNTGMVVDSDTTDSDIDPDGTLNIDGTTNTTITAAAYTNNVGGATGTTLYDIDTTNNRLYTQGTKQGAMPVTSPNTGMLLNPVPLTGATINAINGFDISGNTTVAYASSGNQLYTIDLTTGAVSTVGTIGSFINFTGLTAAPVETLYALTNPAGMPTAQSLVSFNATNPNVASAPLAITGLGTGETLVGIDFRPSTVVATPANPNRRGILYGISVASGTGRVYTINTTSGVATLTGVIATTLGGTPIAISGTEFGVDFNPVPDRIRVISNTGQNLRVNPDNGVTAIDGALNPFDANGTTRTGVSGAAYNNNDNDLATGTTLYDIDSTNDQLLIQNPPNNGTLATVGALGVDVNEVNGFDISGVTTTAYAAFQTNVSTDSSLYTINLTTGAATLVGTIGGTTGNGLVIRGLSATTIGGRSVDNANPTVTINQAAMQADPTNVSPINFTAVFNEPVTGFDSTDVSVTGTAFSSTNPAGTPVITITAVGTDGTTYNVAVSGMTASGTVIATVIAGGAVDLQGNTNVASMSTDNTVTLNGLVFIRGTITQDGVGLSGVNVTLSGDASKTTTTGMDGKYSFDTLTAGGNYLVTPSLTGKVFEPTNRGFNNLTVSVSNADFIAYDANNIPRVVTISNAYTNPGQAVTIPIVVDSLGNEDTFTFTLDYDSTRLTGTPTVACGLQASGCVITTNTTTAGKLGIVVDLATAFAAGTRNQLITVTFQTTSGTAQTNVTFDASGRSISDSNTNGLPASYVNGFVAFSGFESDLAPRNGGDGQVLPNDVVLVRQFVAGTLAFNPNFDEFRRVDSAPRGTFGDGCLKATDVVQARRYSTNLDPLTPVAGPSTPASSAFCDSANFANDAKIRSNDAIQATREVRIASTSVASNATTVVVPIRMDTQGDEAVIQFSINYDTTRLSNPRLRPGTNSTNATFLTNPQMSQSANGSLGILVDFGNGMIAAGQNRELVLVTFDITAPTGASTITFGSSPTVRSVSNQAADELPTSYASGTVTKSAGSTAAGATIGGRVTTSNGKGLVGAIVSMTDTNGVTRTARTVVGGRYQIANVPTGATYVISVASKRYSFEAQPQSINGDTNDINFTALP